MNAFHIHIEGIVQGVGFRPFVYKLAKENNIKGWVNNTLDGVHIHIEVNKEKAKFFMDEILNRLPPLARVTNFTLEKTALQKLVDFKILQSPTKAKPKLLLTPDVAICEDCKEELNDYRNKRFQYPFITCTNCGPRYSIINELPYERFNTTMEGFKMCDSCFEEYNNPMERRHFSQTNSCPECSVKMQLYEKGRYIEEFTNISYIVDKWKEGKIVAIKGIGGYLLTCDATNEKAIITLRERKKRPTKPFALMYPDCNMIAEDMQLKDDEKDVLESNSAPIVLLPITSLRKYKNPLAIKAINNNLSKLGVMLPYAPLYSILLKKFNKPIVATSGNITGSTIVFQDQVALEQLSNIADVILLNNREIMIPQDDGVVQYTYRNRQKIILRRSRGMAPAYINSNLKITNKTVFASGAMLKSVFGLFNMSNTFISQYLGNTYNYDAQLSYEKTFKHFKDLFKTKINIVITDKHPDYFSTDFAKNLAIENGAEIFSVQHHIAHFYSVLGEHNLTETNDKILGVIWDGTGLGDDGNIWGGEFFMLNKKKVERVYHLNEFDFILGDKMPREPRISAFAIAHTILEAEKYIRPKFTKTEWNIYRKLIHKKGNLKCTSMGRLFDGIASLLLDIDKHSFEAEAAMQLEKEASKCYYSQKMSIEDSYFEDDKLPENFVTYIMNRILSDLDNGVNRSLIAAKFHITLVHYIIAVAEKFDARTLAFSGGVFQNALLVDIIIDFMDEKYIYYFQNEFSPNDEGIAFGQLMYFLNKNNN